MNSKQPSTSQSSRGVPSGQRQNMTGPDEGRDPANRLHDLDLSDRGESLEDHQRDRDSKGVAGEYDDSVATRKGDDRDRLGIARGD